MPFQRDDAYQRQLRDTLLVPQFYEWRYPGRYVLMDGDGAAAMAAQRAGIDSYVCETSGAIGLDEKIVRPPKLKKQGFGALCLETWGHGKPGWMHYSQADWLLWCFEQAEGGLDCHLVRDFQLLKRWFWAHEHTLVGFGPHPESGALGKVLPLPQLAQVAAVERFTMHPSWTPRHVAPA